MSTVHVMLDIETLGTKPGSVILSLGAVKFDPMSDQILDKFYVAIDPESCEHYGLDVQASTVTWWFGPDLAEAREKLLNETKLDLASALEGFAEWFGNQSLPIWGNGVAFDNLLVRSAYDAVGMECPWHFGHDRCFRTLKNLLPKTTYPAINQAAHHALDDAIWQAQYMQTIVRRLGLEL